MVHTFVCLHMSKQMTCLTELFQTAIIATSAQ